jgi:hypothetical protein
MYLLTLNFVRRVFLILVIIYRNFSLHHRVQNGSAAHPASYAMGAGGSFPGGKAADVWNRPLTSI